MDKDYRSRQYRCHTSDYSKIVEVTLYAVTPVQNHGTILEIFSYDRIRTEGLDVEEIKHIYQMQNARDVYVLETPTYFLIQYPGKPIIYLSRKDGRLYALREDGFTPEERESQASFVLRMFHKVGKVTNKHSKRLKRNGGKSENKKRLNQDAYIDVKGKIGR